MTAEFDGTPEERYRPDLLVEHYRRIGAELEGEIRNPDSVLRKLIEDYAPGFDINAPAYAPGEVGRANLLWDVGNTIGKKSEGRPRHEVLAANERPALTAEQDTYVQGIATYVGNRYPDPSTERDFLPNNLHLHEGFVRYPNDYKVTIVEAAANEQVRVRTNLAMLSTTGDIIQSASGRAISFYKLDKEGNPTTTVNPEYQKFAAMLGLALPGQVAAEGAQSQIGNIVAGQDTTEFDVFDAYNRLHSGGQREVSTGTSVLSMTGMISLQQPQAGVLDDRCVKVDRSINTEGRSITLIQPEASRLGENASLIDGVRTYLSYLRDTDGIPPGLKVGIVTNGQYYALKELTVARVLTKEFPEVQSLHIIADETGKRDGKTQLEEIARLMRNLADPLRTKE